MPIEGIRDHPLTNIIRNAARGDLFGDSRPLVGWLIHGAAGFVAPAVACWLHLGAVAEGMRSSRPRSYIRRFGSIYGRSPRCKGFFGNLRQRSAAAIYSVFGATSLPTLMRYADWRPIILAGFGAR
jgi:hypothetical protein